MTTYRGTELEKAISVDDIHRRAKKRLPKVIYDYLMGGAEDEMTLARNIAAFDCYALRPRVLRGVYPPDTSIRLFGKKIKQPFLIAPTGLNGIFYPEADLALAAAAARIGTIFSVSTAATSSLEEISSHTEGIKWFQLYPWGDGELSRHLIARAKKADYEALVLTVDSLIPGKRERDLRNKFAHQVKITPRIIIDGLLHPRWLFSVWLRTGMPRLENIAELLPPGSSAKDLADYSRKARNPRFSWNEVKEIRRQWDGPIVIKGILTAEDALLARKEGVDGIVVSNHGGRQLDGTYASLDALQKVRAALGDTMAVLVDGGFRRGSDILKALSLGANAVMLGRLPLMGLAANGEEGVDEALKLVATEVETTAALMGLANLGELGPESIERVDIVSTGLRRRY